MKFFFKVVAFFVVIGVLAALYFLLPAHFQVREVNPDLPSVSMLRELLQVDNAPVRVSYVTTSTQRTNAGTLGHNSIVVEWSNGDMVLIDTGMDEHEARKFGELMQSVLGGEEAVVNGTISQLLGDDLSRVKAVGFTHLHIDHTQGLLDFCSAAQPQVLGLQLEYQREMHNFNTTEGADIIAGSCLTPVNVGEQGLLTVEQFPGLAMYPLGGHTPGSTLFAVAHGDRVLLFSGDITNSKADLLNNKGKGAIYSYLLVPESTKRTAKLRTWLRDLNNNPDMDVVVSHDIEDMAGILQPFK